MNDEERAPGRPGETTATPDESAATRRHPFRPVVAVTVVVLLGLLATAGVRSYRDLAEAKAYEQRLLDDVAETEARIQALDRRIDRIRHDPVTLERLAREDLGMVRAGDVVIVLPEDRPAGSPGAGTDRAEAFP